MPPKIDREFFLAGANCLLCSPSHFSCGLSGIPDLGNREFISFNLVLVFGPRFDLSNSFNTKSGTGMASIAWFSVF